MIAQDLGRFLLAAFRSVYGQKTSGNPKGFESNFSAQLTV